MRSDGGPPVTSNAPDTRGGAASLNGTALRVDGLTVEFATEHGPVTVVRDVGWELKSGETLGLVGESGSGKTVTGLSVLGLLPDNGRVVSGVVEFEGQNLLALDSAALRRIRGPGISMIFQEPRRSLDPCFTVGHQVAETIRAHNDVSRNDAFRQAVEMLDRVRIPAAERRARDYPHQLSGGQCQRVMLAIALACRPKVLIADEPTTALDVTVQAAMLSLIADLQREMNLSVLLVTHDLGVVANTCDRVAVMYAGELVEEASVVDVFDSTRHPYTRGLLRSIAQTADGGLRLNAIRGVVPAAHEWPAGCRFNPRCDFAVDECREAEPPLIQLDRGRRVRCIRVEEIGVGSDG